MPQAAQQANTNTTRTRRTTEATLTEDEEDIVKIKDPTPEEQGEWVVKHYLRYGKVTLYRNGQDPDHRDTETIVVQSDRLEVISKGLSDNEYAQNIRGRGKARQSVSNFFVDKLKLPLTTPMYIYNPGGITRPFHDPEDLPEFDKNTDMRTGGGDFIVSTKNKKLPGCDLLATVTLKDLVGSYGESVKTEGISSGRKFKFVVHKSNKFIGETNDLNVAKAMYEDSTVGVDGKVTFGGQTHGHPDGSGAPAVANQTAAQVGEEHTMASSPRGTRTPDMAAYVSSIKVTPAPQNMELIINEINKASYPIRKRLHESDPLYGASGDATTSGHVADGAGPGVNQTAAQAGAEHHMAGVDASVFPNTGGIPGGPRVDPTKYTAENSFVEKIMGTQYRYLKTESSTAGIFQGNFVVIRDKGTKIEIDRGSVKSMNRPAKTVTIGTMNDSYKEYSLETYDVFKLCS